MRIVFDTSSLIPACLYPSREPAQIFRRALLTHQIFSSVETFNELASVLTRDKFQAWQPLEHRLMWIKLFYEAVTQVTITASVKECRDPKDNKFLELGVSAHADVLVSSDIHLLEMHPFQGIKILSLTEFKNTVLGEI